MVLFAAFATLFSYYDKNGDGNLSTEELPEVMRHLGLNPTQQEVQQFLKELDLDSKQYNYEAHYLKQQQQQQQQQHTQQKKPINI